MKDINYVGFVGQKNIGDEAIYEASKKLFSKWNLVLYYENPNSDVLLIGGGTMIPSATTGRRDYEFSGESLRFAIGVGVQSPEFHNRKRTAIDVTHYLGGKGIDTQNVIDSAGIFGTVIRRLSDAFDDPAGINREYFNKKDYESIGTFGFNKIGVRGPDSCDIIKRHTDLKSSIVGDTALYLRPDNFISDRTGKIAVVLRKSGNKWTNKSRYVKVIVEVLNEHSSKYEYVLLPFYPPDRELHQQVNRNLKNSELIDYTSPLDVDGVINEISQADAVVGEKLHANVLSACCHVPMISLEYRPKNRDFMSHIGLEDYNIRIDEVTTKRFRSIFEKCMDNNKEIVTHLQKRIPEIKEGLDCFSSEVKEMVAKELGTN